MYGHVEKKDIIIRNDVFCYSYVESILYDYKVFSINHNFLRSHTIYNMISKYILRNSILLTLYYEQLYLCCVQYSLLYHLCFL